MKAFETVDSYVASFPSDIQAKLKGLRQIVQDEAPQAEEKISYGIPYYSLNGRLIYFAAFRDHFSLFPASRSVFDVFEKELQSYETSKGTIRFPMDKPLPEKLIGQIIKFRVKENSAKK